MGHESASCLNHQPLLVVKSIIVQCVAWHAQPTTTRAIHTLHDHHVTRYMIIMLHAT
jgi:hypothetical protein